MAICNLFKKLTKQTGNFLMFSQYTEDLTKCTTEPGFYKVVPSKFIVMENNYNHINIEKYGDDLNMAVARYFQNEFENGCALMREKLQNTKSPIQLNDSLNHWSSNIFWDTMNKSNFLQEDSFTLNDTNYNYVKNIKYIGDINIQSFDTIEGMGYNEIYCFIPSDACLQKYELITGTVSFTINTGNKRKVEGYNEDPQIPNIDITFPDQITYDYGKEREFQRIRIDEKNDFLFNTIVILYDIYIKNQEGTSIIYKQNIPMGIYFTGLINPDGTVNNSHNKYINNPDIYDSGTSYGLRLCSRFTSTPNSESLKIVNASTEDVSYSTYCKLMSAMADTQSKMDEILKQLHEKDQKYNELYSIFKNSRTNVPYIKNVAGVDYWFVNGKKISKK